MTAVPALGLAESLFFDIPAQPLPAALRAFAAQARMQLLYQFDAVKDLQSSPVRGTLETRVALQEVLRNTGLEVVYSSDKAATIRQLSPGSPASKPGEASNETLASKPAGGVNADGGRAPPLNDPARARFLCGSVAAVRGACTQDPAQAQSASTVQPATSQMTEVVITGSRVIGNGNDSPAPVTVITTEDIAATHPATIFDGLNDLPVFSGSRGLTANPGVGNATNNNVSAVNLRALGLYRTLVLYDGHRVPPITADGLIDVNMIPQMLLQRVDVVTGGASAVYGSDAVAGVVNFITDTDFQGFKANVQGGLSKYRDDESYDAGLALGTDLFDGRGHLTASYETHRDAGVSHRTNRPLGAPMWTMQGNGTTVPYNLQANVRIADYTFGGKIRSGIWNNYQFAADGALTAFRDGLSGAANGLASSTVQIGGDGSYHTASQLKAMLRMHQAFGRLDYDLTDHLHAYLKATASWVYNSNNNTNNRIQNVTLSGQNAFLAAAYRTPGTFSFGKMWSEDVVPPQNIDNHERHYLLDAGVEGDFGRGYKWNASFIHSVARINARQNANINNGRLAAALDAVSDASGRIVCNVALTHPGLYPGCVPLNVFGPTAENAVAVDYVIDPTQVWAKTTMNDASASVIGAPFSNWAGPVNLALSGEIRRLSYKLDSDALPVQLSPLDCTGLRFNCTTADPTAGVLGTAQWGSGVAPRTPVGMTVSEAALEVDLPVLKDLPFVQAANVNAAARFAHYSTTGDATTWKLGLGWSLNDQWTLRSTRSRDIRAPNLNDLYAPTTIIYTAFQDVLTNTSPLVPVQSGGNPNLAPEVGYTSTLGFVFRPAERFSLAVDAFDIAISNAITAVNGQSNNIQQACYQTGGASPYCSMQERPLGYADSSTANAVTKWYSRPLNIASQETWGVDVEANYSALLFGRSFSVRTLLTYQPHIVYTQPGVNTYDMAGVDFNNSGLQASPVWRTSMFLRYSPLEYFTIDLSERWRSSLHHDADPTLSVAPPNHVASVAYTNLNLTYRMPLAAGQADLYFNVRNLFDKQPPATAFVGANQEPGLFGGYAYGDDPVGRYYSLGVRLKWL